MAKSERERAKKKKVQYVNSKVFVKSYDISRYHAERRGVIYYRGVTLRIQLVADE